MSTAPRRARRLRYLGVLLTLPLLLLGSACTAGSATGGGSDAGTGEEETTLTVFAAASLQEPFTELAERYDDAHPGTTVRLSFAGSSDLATQIAQGAPADVLATADTVTMDRVVEAGDTAAEPTIFATNTLTIAVPPGNPARVASLADLAEPALDLVLCAPQVPCGRAAADLATAEALDLSPVSEEQSVTDVLGKVESGEAEAGLVYETDVVRADGSVEEVEDAATAAVVNEYPIAPVADAGAPEDAAAFLELVASPEGQEILSARGFGAP